MRKNKFIKLIEHILVALPILMIVATTCYTIFNSNAKDSYSGELGGYYTQEKAYQTNVVNTLDDIHIDNVYLFNCYSADLGDYISDGYGFVLDGVLLSSNKMFLDNFTLDEIISEENDDNLLLLSLSDTNFSYTVSNKGTDTFTFGASVTFDLQTTSWFVLQLQYFDVSGDTNFIKFIQECPQELIPNTYVETPVTTLDKAFENSMNEFNNLGFNKINFTGFFENIFFEGQPNVYLSFVNCYLNYMLLIECAFILPLVLYWFIHVGESILYRFEKGEW